MIKPFSAVTEFHGHACVGLALGYKAAGYATEILDLTFSDDEEVVAITETDSCTVDAVQVVLGCTAGKGNLFVNKWGKNAFTFYRRDNNTSVRLVAIPDAFMPSPEMTELRPKIMNGSASDEEKKRFRRLSDEAVDAVLAMPFEKLFEKKEARIEVPEKARIFRTVTCSVCNEPVADGFATEKDGKFVCIPCGI